MTDRYVSCHDDCCEGIVYDKVLVGSATAGYGLSRAPHN